MLEMDDGSAEISINFTKEPAKSKKQLSKLIRVVQDYVMPRAELFSYIK